MASRLSTLALKNNVKKFILESPQDQSLDAIVEEAIINADRDLRIADSLSPLAWDITPFDGLRTVTYAAISDITAADPGVITAASVDSSVTGHGFHDHDSIRDIVVIDGIAGMEELNSRVFLLQYIDTTTFSLKSLDGLSDIDTSSYTAYSSSGFVYHAGFVLNTTTILADVSSQWTIKQLLPHPTIDGYPLYPITEAEAKKWRWQDPGFRTRPERYRYWKNMTTASTVNEYIFLYPVCSQPYNISIPYQKEIPDISVWSASTYPFHPPQVHDAIWHGALAKLVGISRRVQRSNDKVIATQLEIAWKERWEGEWRKDLIRTVELSRQMMGDLGGASGISA